MESDAAASAPPINHDGVAARLSSMPVKRLMQALLAGQLGLACLLVYADVSGRQSIFGRDAIRPEIMEPVAPGDQRRPYRPRAVPTLPDDRRPAAMPLRLPSDMDRLSFDVMETEAYGRVMLLSGSIEHGDAARFERALDESPAPPAIIALHSPGGRPTEAMRIGQIVRERDLDTLMAPGAACVSACPLILFGGVERVISRKAWVGLHQTYYDDGVFIPMPRAVSDIQSLQAETLRYTQSMGVDPAVHVHALETPPDDAYFLVEAEMKRYEVATKIVE